MVTKAWMILFKLAAEEVKAELGPICWRQTTESTNREGEEKASQRKLL